MGAIDELLSFANASGLFETGRLDGHIAQLKTAGVEPNDPESLARYWIRDGLATPFQARLLLRGKPGFFLAGKYKVLDLLGAGGSGKVYLCEHLRLRRPVAVKVLPRGAVSSKSTVERFYREARAVAAVEHPNIVRVFDIDKAGSLHFMVMEFVDGASLQDVVEATGPMAPERAAQYIRQAAAGLAKAHEMGWIHRDVKPANILVDRVGTIKLLDLGLARLTTPGSDNLTAEYQERYVMGTADYIAPEQASGDLDVDHRVDLYSLGATFYFLLAGRPPFAEGALPLKLLWHQTRQPPPITSFRSDVPDAMLIILDRLLAKDRQRRFQSANEVVDALAALVPKGLFAPSSAETPRLCRALRDMGIGAGAAKDEPTAADSLTVLDGVQPGPMTPSHGPRVEDTQKFNIAATPRVRLGEGGVTPSRSADSRALDARPDLKEVGAAAPIDSPTAETSTQPAAELGTRPPQFGGPIFRVVAGGLVCVLVGLIFAAPWIGPRVSDGGPKNASMQQPSAVDLETIFAPSGERTPIVVTEDPVLLRKFRRRVLPSIAAALEKAQPGDVIRVVAGTDDAGRPVPLHAPGLMLKSTTPRNITLEGWQLPSGGKATWELSGGRPADQPLVSVSEVQGFRLRNFHLVGDDQVSHLLTVTGRCAGLHLEDLWLEGSLRAAVRLSDAAGERDDVILLRRLRFISKPYLRGEAGIQLAAGPNRATEEVLVADNRFEGPMESGVLFSGAASYVEFRGNRFYRMDAALAFQKDASHPCRRVTVANNTFFDVISVLQFAGKPNLTAARRDNAFSLVDNLFCETKSLVQFAEAVNDPNAIHERLFGKLSGNIREPSACLEGVFFPEIEARNVGRLSTNPSDESFLRYDKSSPLNLAGHGGNPVGAAPGS